MAQFKPHKRLVFTLACIFLILMAALASGEDILFIESPGCSKCAAAEKVLEETIAEGTDLTLVTYDYFSEDGHRIIKEHKVKDVPSIIVGGQVIGYRDYDGNKTELKQLVQEALENRSVVSVGNSVSEVIPGPGAVFVAGLLAGFNPCLIAVLVFLAASVMSTSRRKRDLVIMIVSFSMGIFSMYYLFGLGMQQFLQGPASEGFKIVLTALLAVLGISQIEDARRLWGGKSSLFRTDWALKYLETGATRGRVGSYFLVGALFSLVKAPCVGAVYLAILDMVSSQTRTGWIYLMLYNLGVILPILLLGGLIALGLSPEEVDKFRKEYRAPIRLITGLTLIALAPLIYWGIL